MGGLPNVILSVPERWDLYWENIESIVQICSECSVLDGNFKVFIRGCNNSNINVSRFLVSNALEFTFLKYTE